MGAFTTAPPEPAQPATPPITSTPATATAANPRLLLRNLTTSDGRPPFLRPKVAGRAVSRPGISRRDGGYAEARLRLAEPVLTTRVGCLRDRSGRVLCLARVESCHVFVRQSS